MNCCPGIDGNSGVGLKRPAVEYDLTTAVCVWKPELSHGILKNSLAETG